MRFVKMVEESYLINESHDGNLHNEIIIHKFYTRNELTLVSTRAYNNNQDCPD